VKRQHVVKNSFVPILIGLFLMTGCAPPPRGGEPIGKIQDAFRPEQSARQEAKIPLPPPEIRSALLPSARTLDLGSEEPAEARFDIAASQVPAREFFMSLVQGSRFNMVVHPEVSGEITIDLKNTTVQEVLQVVHNVYGYPYFSTGNIYQVMPIGLRAQTFQVNYLNLIRKGQSQTRVSSGQVTQGGTSKNDQGSQSNENKNSTVSGSSIETASVADFWGELRNAIQSLVGTEGGRKVVVQPQASVVVVVAMPDELQLVGEYLRTVQSNLQRQVVIEAKVIEVSLGDGFQTGINWAALGKPGGGKTILAGQSGGGSVFSKGVSESAGNSGNLTPGQALPDGIAGGKLLAISSIRLEGRDPRVNTAQFLIAGDVENRLLGTRGAAAVFAPQKGADRDDVAVLEQNLAHFARIMLRDTGIKVTSLKGGGAAGGAAAGLVALLGATLAVGTDLIFDTVRLAEHLREADIVITGEGRIDAQTAGGKVPVGVARAAARFGIPVIAVGGSLADSANSLFAHNIDALESTVVRDMSLDRAIRSARTNLHNAGERIGRWILLAERLGSRRRLKVKS